MNLHNYKFFSLLKEDQIKRIEQCLLQYPSQKKNAAIIQIMHIIQESTRWISKENLLEIADFLSVPQAKAEEIASFYPMFYYNKPVGRFVISICRTTPCWICNSDATTEKIKSLLKININETTQDQIFTLHEVECLGRCSESPIVKVNNEVFTKVDEKKAEKIIKDLMLNAKNENHTYETK